MAFRAAGYVGHPPAAQNAPSDTAKGRQTGAWHHWPAPHQLGRQRASLAASLPQPAVSAVAELGRLLPPLKVFAQVLAIFRLMRLTSCG
jgi:predicted small lipoprotein YifL